MHRLRTLGCAVAALAAAALASPGHAAESAVFQQIVEHRLAAMIANARAERTTPRPDAAPGYVEVGEDGGVSDKPDDGSDFFVVASEAALAARVADMRVQRHGDTAVAVYRLELSLRFRPKDRAG